MKATGHLASLDGIRGIAILMVICCHLTFGQIAAGMPNAVRSVMILGWAGVDLFFALSGFLITGILLDKRAPGKELDFYKRRFFRIAPIYYLVLLIGVLAAPHSSLYRNTIPSPLGIASYVVYLQNWYLPMREPGQYLFAHFWSLAVEEQFYLIWPWFVWKLRPKTLVSVCLSGIALALVVRLLTINTDFPIFFSTLTRMDGLLAGSLAAILIRNQRLLPTARPVAAFVAIGALASWAFFIVRSHEIHVFGFFTLTFGFSLLSIGFAAFTFWAAANDRSRSLPIKGLRFTPLRSVGRYAYGMYVYHPYVLAIGAASSPWLRGWWGCVAFTCAFYAVAALSYELFEKRFLAIPRRTFTLRLPPLLVSEPSELQR